MNSDERLFILEKETINVREAPINTGLHFQKIACRKF
ncbi:hypothetical protein MHK_001682 [Candidatus Magnetomorum sp. HK-1]|nr:hypothetical protein MHK_001682 [Candidatus Magnetomorum sp. HK-1]